MNGKELDIARFVRPNRLFNRVGFSWQLRKLGYQVLEEALVHLVPADDAPAAGKGVGRDWSGLTVLFKCVHPTYAFAGV